MQDVIVTIIFYAIGGVIGVAITTLWGERYIFPFYDRWFYYKPRELMTWCRVRYNLTRRMNECLAGVERASYWGDRMEHQHYMMGANYYIELMGLQRTHALPFDRHDTN